MREIIEINEIGIYVLKNKHNVDIETLAIHLDVLSISLVSCKIRKIPRNFFEKFTKLESIDLYDNYLISTEFTIPDTVTTINLSYNMLENFEMDVKRLEFVDLRYNKLTESPACLMNVRKNLEGNNFSYQNFVIRNNFYPDDAVPQHAVPQHAVPQHVDAVPQHAVPRHVDAVPRHAVPRHVITENIPNVHDTHIQTSTMKSIEILMKTYDSQIFNPNYMLEIKQHIFPSKFNYKFNKYFNPLGRNMRFVNELKYYHSLNSDVVYNYTGYKTCKIYQLIERVWNFAKTSEYKESVIENMIIQVLDGKGYCFVGKYTRLINTIVAFHEDVIIHIPFSERFSDELKKMGGIKNKETRERMEKFVNDSDIATKDKEIWLGAIEEFFDEE